MFVTFYCITVISTNCLIRVSSHSYRIRKAGNIYIRLDESGVVLTKRKKWPNISSQMVFWSRMTSAFTVPYNLPHQRESVIEASLTSDQGVNTNWSLGPTSITLVTGETVAIDKSNTTIPTGRTVTGFIFLVFFIKANNHCVHILRSSLTDLM